MSRTRTVGLLRLFRLELPFAAGVCVILGILLATGRQAPPKETVLGFLSVFFLSAAALILNDYFDIESDRINAPDRPLPAGLVSAQDVVVLSIVVTLFGLVTAGLISPAALLAAILVWAAGFLYNWRLKKTGFLGNLLVCFSVGMTFIYGGIAAGKPFEATVWLFGAMAMLVDLGEEIAADAMDVAGDREAGSRSLALRLGSENALRISGLIFLLVIIASSLPFLLGWLNWIYLLPLAFMDLAILYCTARLLDPRTANRRTVIRWIYVSATAALLIFIIIRMVS